MRIVRYILIFGNPVDGMRFEGPFESFDDAEDHSMQHDNDWWIAELDDPSHGEPDGNKKETSNA